MSHGDRYELYYWPQIQGRGEFVRLLLEEGGADYVDVARLPPEQGGGIPALMALLANADEPTFAPPILKLEGRLVAQTALILHVLAPRLKLVPDSDASRQRALQLQLTITDFVLEAHDTHHPLGPSFYYEDQKPEALRRTMDFVKARMPKYLGYFERVLATHDGAGMLGADISYVDLSMFQIVSGLRYAFPKGLAALAPKIPLVLALADRVAARPRIRDYLASPRRVPFNEHGIFRKYPELDVVP